jgi:hypothetical protein
MTDESNVIRNWQADSRRRTVPAPDAAFGEDADPGPIVEGSGESLTAVDVGRRSGERPRPGP